MALLFSQSTRGRYAEKAGYQPTEFIRVTLPLRLMGNICWWLAGNTNEIQIFARDAETGLLQDTGEKIEMSKPVCLKFVPMD